MIKFEHSHGDLRCAIFAGDTSELCADLCLEMSLIYGAIVSKNENAAKEFRRNMMLSFVEPELSEKIFSGELYNSIVNSGEYESGNVVIPNKEEFARQLKELLNEDE